MLLLKRMALAVILSGCSETAIAQQTPPAQPAAPATPHSEPWWNSKYGEADARELAKVGASEFLFILSPARIQGAVQMIVTPIAIR